ncbi:MULTISPECIES: SGNH/GDSL hydrolase family protein [unclassified Rathayibacter]|uniref:SGNH/GDSL hydrolase family protein n=1 Tax=unclassified Rathayibacter TaxID=2609250 RepID=UPI00188B1B1A|nr:MULTISPECIES: SGNH/GDSL hydrolase family protein [unclassified Rathayibacter]MBF4462154.1 SGNH/GDSL hydrolase family protein [Rathayibacter sp. VKM Ac-2879]MBF4503803.1 SGNH/GDSL hydrolase family protein [Rathayibacter sp. VKM Ac-2878]
MRARRLYTAPAALAVGALALAGCASLSVTQQVPGPAGEPATDSATATPPDTWINVAALPAGSRVAVVGDSIVRGLNVEPEQAWPALVGNDFGWDVTNLGCDGGGFVEPGDCDAAIGDRAAEIADTHPDAIVLIASSNDLGWPSDTVDEAIAPAVDAIAAASPSARLLSIDSVWGPDPRPTDLNDYDAALATAVTDAGGVALQYPDPLEAGDLLGDDGVHPTVEGQEALAAAFELAAEKVGLAAPVQTDQRATHAPDGTDGTDGTENSDGTDGTDGTENSDGTDAVDGADAPN